jgi:hypothetical protein
MGAADDVYAIKCRVICASPSIKTFGGAQCITPFI